jgi:hypothetical protein
VNFRHLVPAFAAAALVTGCTSPTAYTSTPAYNRYQVEDIIAMSKGGESDGRIIDKLQEANGFYPLTASEIVTLHGEGVSLGVLDYMQKTYLRGVRREERFQMPGRFSSKY